MCGCYGGIIGTILSHPFDTIRIKTQMNGVNIGRNIMDIYKSYGICGFYRGITPPILSISLEKSIVFGVYNNIVNQKYFKNKYINDGFSGYISGIAASLFVAPMEAIKINQQYHPNYSTRMCIDTLIKSRSLFKSLGPTLWREPPGFAIYFSVYNSISDLSPYKSLYHKFIYGSMAGCISWIFIYPADVIKTRVQLDHSMGLFDHIRHAYHEKLLYKGFSLSIMRAIPLHGGAFFGYEYLKDKLI